MPSILCSNYKGLPALPEVFSHDFSVHTIMTKVNIDSVIECNSILCTDSVAMQFLLILQARRSVSKQVSALRPLSSRTKKQIARLLVSMCKLSTPFNPSSWASLLGQWSECRHLLWHGATRLPSACCFPQSMYTHNAFHLHLHTLCYRLGTCEVHSCWQNA